MQFLLCAHTDFRSLALRPKCGRQDHRGSPGIKEKVECCVDMSMQSDVSGIMELSASFLIVNGQVVRLEG